MFINDICSVVWGKIHKDLWDEIPKEVHKKTREQVLNWIYLEAHNEVVDGIHFQITQQLQSKFKS